MFGKDDWTRPCLSLMLHEQALSAEEQQARRDRLAKMRALLFYHERKAARMKAIKSKVRWRFAKGAAHKTCA